VADATSRDSGSSHPVRMSTYGVLPTPPQSTAKGRAYRLRLKSFVLEDLLNYAIKQLALKVYGGVEA
jgi:hypothetical protein